MPNINLIGVLIAGILGMGVGILWYGPIFGKLWIKLMGFTKEDMDSAKQKGMIVSYVIGLAGQLLTAYALAAIIAFSFQYFGGFHFLPIVLIWLGIVVPIQIGNVLWEGKSWTLFALNSAYFLAQMLIMGVALNYLG